MRPRNTNLEPNPPEFPKPARTPRWLLLVGIGTMLVVMGLGYVSLRVVQRIRQLKHLQAEIQAGYQQLDRDFPFAPPPNPSVPEAARLAAYHRARMSVSSQILPSVEARAHTWLYEARPASIHDVAQLFGSFYQFLDRGTEAHLAELRESEMGPSEFFWIHGYMVSNVLDASVEDPRRVHLDSVLEALERTSAPLSRDEDQFVVRRFRSELDHRYEGFPEIPQSEISDFSISGDAMACLDILAATPSLLTGLGLPQPGRESASRLTTIPNRQDQPINPSPSARAHEAS